MLSMPDKNRAHSQVHRFTGSQVGFTTATQQYAKINTEQRHNSHDTADTASSGHARSKHSKHRSSHMAIMAVMAIMASDGICLLAWSNQSNHSKLQLKVKRAANTRKNET